MYTIEKNVPLPPTTRPTPYVELTSTLATMEVGDSFLLNDVRKNTHSVVYEHGRTHGRKYSVRKVGDSAVRIWRVS